MRETYHRNGLALGLCLAMLGCEAAPADEAGSTGPSTASETALLTCSEAVDCGPLEDGDACNGTFTCDADKQHCVIDPKTVVTCATDNDTVCATNRCDAQTGKCAMKPHQAGTVCDDGDPCSVGDSCAGGTCTAGAVNACQCRTDSECSDHEDGDKCNGTLYCDKGLWPWSCKVNPASVVLCPPGDEACKTAMCDGKTGKCTAKNNAEGSTCDDDDPCTVNDQCASGGCVGVQTCTCKTTKDCGPLEDGNPCNGTLFCDSKAKKCVVNPATVVQCDASGDTICKKNTCQPTTGVCMPMAAPGSTACDDGDKCTAGDHCNGGSCAPGKSVCTCKLDSDCLAHDDGDKCNGLKFCDKATGSCKDNPGSVVNCPSVGDTACAHNVCLPKEGTCTMAARADVTLHCALQKDAFGKSVQVCKWQTKTAKDGSKPADKGPFVCDDGDVCTSGDVCEGKLCKASAVTCKCKSNADCVVKDDGDLCNGTMYCDKSLKVPDCVHNPASKVFCSKKDDTDCLKAQCDAKTGMCGLHPVKSGATCDDGKPCTAKTTCDGAGACAGGAKNTCDDGDLCTVDACAPGKGCGHQVKTCDDGNSCTQDGCDAKTGKCALKPLKEGAVCNADDDGCTVNDSCTSGACKAGAPLQCKAQVGSCEAVSCTTTSHSTFKCVVVAKPDKTPCPDDPKSCYVGARCDSGKCKAGTVPRLFEKLMHDSKEDAFFAAVAAPKPGLIVAAGGRTVGAWKNATERRWLAVGSDGTGKVLWSWQNNPPHKSPLNQVGAITAGPGGSVYLAGTYNRGTQIGFRVRRLLANGKEDIAWNGGAGSKTVRVVGATRLADGSVAVASQWRYSNNVSDSSFDVFSASGKHLWFGIVGGHAVSLSATADRLVVATQVSWGTSSSGLFAIYDTITRKPLINFLPGMGAYTHRAAGAVLFADGHMQWQVTGKDNKGHTSTTLYTKNGTIVVIRGTLSVALVAKGLARHGSGTLSYGHTPGTTQAIMYRLDRFGNVKWGVALLPGQSANVASVVAAANTDAVAAGHVTAPDGRRRPFLARLSDLGMTHCGLGKCAGKSQADCDDGNQCSTDGCDPQSGCVHTLPAGNLCDPKDGCSLFGPCVQGKCSAGSSGTLYNSGHFQNSTLHSRNDAVVALPDGRVRTLNMLQPNAGVATLTYSHQGAIGSTGFGPAQKRAVCVAGMQFHAVQPLSDGSFAVAGQVGAPGLAVVCKVAKNGGVVPGSVAFWWACPGCATAARGVSSFANAGLFVASSATAGRRRSEVRRINGAKTAWTTSFHSATEDYEALGISTLADATSVVVGRRRQSGAWQAWLARVGADGKKLFDVTKSVTGDASLYDVTASGKTGLIAVGETALNAIAKTGLIVAVTVPTGKVLWARVSTPANLAAYRRILPEPDGGAAIAGGIVAGGKHRILLERITSAGATVWSRSYTSGTAEIKLGLAGLGRWQHGYLLGGGRASGKDNPTLIRTNNSGHGQCDHAGVCANYKKVTCDDANPCTVDSCDAKAGCKHMPVPGCK